MIWDFMQRYDESWIWRCADRHEITESSRNFAALDECMADAARHGYVTPRAKTGQRIGRDVGEPAPRKRKIPAVREQ